MIFARRWGFAAGGGAAAPAEALPLRRSRWAAPCRTAPIRCRSSAILSELDITHDFYYSESFFDHPATQYDHQLALVTLGMVVAAFNYRAVSDAQYWVNGAVGREDESRRRL